MEYTIKEWLIEGERLFGKDKKKWKFVCPSCGNIQSYEDFEKLPNKPEEIQDYMAFTCIGRFLPDCKGTIFNKEKPCNYTNGGLFDFSKVKVKTEDGESHSVFDFYKEEK